MNRHRFDPGAPAAGLFFLAAAALFLAGGFAEEAVLGIDILAPVAVAGLGAVGIIRVLTRGRRRDPR